MSGVKYVLNSCTHTGASANSAGSRNSTIHSVRIPKYWRPPYVGCICTHFPATKRPFVGLRSKPVSGCSGWWPLAGHCEYLRPIAGAKHAGGGATASESQLSQLYGFVAPSTVIVNHLTCFGCPVLRCCHNYRNFVS